MVLTGRGCQIFDFSPSLLALNIICRFVFPSLVPPSLAFPLALKLFTRIHPFLRDFARAASVLVSITSDSRYSTTAKDMAHTVTNGPNGPNRTNARGSQSSKMHSKVVSVVLFFPLSPSS